MRKMCLICYFYGTPNHDNAEDFSEINTTADFCHKYPAKVMKNHNDWCGELRSRINAISPAEWANISKRK